MAAKQTLEPSQNTDDVLLTRSVTAAERARYLSQDFVHLASLWDAKLAEDLAAEAYDRWPTAKVPTRGPRTPVVKAHRQHTGTPTATGLLLKRLHFSLAGIARALTGQFLLPAFSAYGYYSINDGVLLHTDQSRCKLTFLTLVFGDVGPLHLHPALCGLTMEKLGILESDPTWNHASGHVVGYPKLGVLAFAGNRLPHNRPGREVKTLSVVAALCYESLFTPGP